MTLVATKWRALIWFLNTTPPKEAAQETHPTSLMTVSPSSGSVRVVLIQRVVPSQQCLPAQQEQLLVRLETSLDTAGIHLVR